MINDVNKAALREWMDSPAEGRDYSRGLQLLVAVSGNRMLLFTIPVPEHRKEYIDYQLSKYADIMRNSDAASQVREMTRQVREIVSSNLSLSEEKDANPARGKRDDHDSLPDEVKACYVENLEILRRIRELNLRLRGINDQEAAQNGDSLAFDAKRRPLLETIIDLDKRMHANWKKYDTFSLQSDSIE